MNVVRGTTVLTVLLGLAGCAPEPQVTLADIVAYQESINFLMQHPCDAWSYVPEVPGQGAVPAPEVPDTGRGPAPEVQVTGAEPAPEVQVLGRESLSVSQLPGAEPLPPATRDTIDIVAAGLTGESPEEAVLENEVHDCQRMIEWNQRSLQYGPLKGVFPITSAMEHRDVSSFAEPVVVASIFDFGVPDPVERYTDPGGLRCLWLHHAGGTWRAAIATAPSWRWCTQATKAPDPAQFNYLPVDAFSSQGLAPDDYPKTARWEWDHVRGQQYIGIKCAAAWCRIGPPGFTPQPLSDGQGFSKYDIPGYYDAQHLAVYDSVSRRLRPGPWGEIRPVPGLDTVDFSEKSLAARISIRPLMPLASSQMRPPENPVDKYAVRFNLEEADGWWQGEVYLKINKSGGAVSNVTAYYRNRSGGEISSAAVKYSAGERHGPSGSVRWRWRDTDEDGWIECEVGCCWPTH